MPGIGCSSRSVAGGSKEKVRDGLLDLRTLAVVALEVLLGEVDFRGRHLQGLSHVLFVQHLEGHLGLRFAGAPGRADDGASQVSGQGNADDGDPVIVLAQNHGAPAVVRDDGNVRAASPSIGSSSTPPGTRLACGNTSDAAAAMPEATIAATKLEPAQRLRFTL